MMMRQDSPPALAEQDLIVVQGGRAYLTDVERRLAPYFERSEPRQRAIAYLRGLLSPAERKNSWQLAEVSGDATPYGFQHLLRRALWDPEAVRDELRRYVIQHLGAPEAVVVLDATGSLKKGRHSVGGARQYSGTAGKVENGQIGVVVGYAGRLGQTLLDRERYLPNEWTNDRERCQQAGIPAEQRFATKPQLAQQMLARAFAAGVPALWVTGDSVYCNDRRLRGAGGPAPGLCAGGLGARVCVAGRPAAAGQNTAGRAFRRRLDPPQCRRRDQRSPVVRLALAVLGRRTGARLVPLAAGAAACERPTGAASLRDLRGSGDHRGGRGPGGGNALDT